jgi:hypothetical protein
MLYKFKTKCRRRGSHAGRDGPHDAGIIGKHAGPTGIIQDEY